MEKTEQKTKKENRKGKRTFKGNCGRKRINREGERERKRERERERE